MNSKSLSIIIPSYNQAKFLERTLLSIIQQNAIGIEIIVIDGGSCDGSVEILKKYESELSYWVSEPDLGQANAINKGLKIACGEWVAWQNSDDFYYPGAIDGFFTAMHKDPAIELIIANMNMVDLNDLVIRDLKYVRPTYESLLAEGMVLTNQAAFWRRSLHQEIGFLNEGLDCGFDYDWFLRLLQTRCKVKHVNKTWGALRMHEDTKTSLQQDVFAKEYAAILKGREPSIYIRLLYRFRRLFLMILQAEFSYLFRGLVHRLSFIHKF